MRESTYYGLKLVEGSDIVNPLVTEVPNMEIIDEQLHNNQIAGVTMATETANGRVHAFTRADSEKAVIRFIATANWKSGDSATVDGVPVTVLLPNGETLPDNGYVINANVLGILTGSIFTVYASPKVAKTSAEITHGDGTVATALSKMEHDINTGITSLRADTEADIAKVESKLESNTAKVNLLDKEMDTKNGIKRVTTTINVPVLSAGASGYWNFTTPEEVDVDKMISVYLSSSGLAELNGLQLTPIYFGSATFFVNYYAPKAITKSKDVVVVFSMYE